MAKLYGRAGRDIRRAMGSGGAGGTQPSTGGSNASKPVRGHRGGQTASEIFCNLATRAQSLEGGELALFAKCDGLSLLVDLCRASARRVRGSKR